MRQIFRTTRQRQTDLSRDGGIVLRMNAARISRDARLARIRIFANRHRQRQLTKQRHMVVFAHRLRTACAETDSVFRMASSAAKAPAAFSNWLAPASAG